MQQIGLKYSTKATKSSKYFITASDTAFGDLPNQHSSEGYLTILYERPIDWCAVKQKTIITSSTEAEFLAILEAGKTLY